MGQDIKQYFTNKVIKVDRGGPESRIGKLLDAGDDYFAVLTVDEGVVYYHTRHIKSFTEYKKTQMEFDFEVPKDFKFNKAKNFKELLESLNYLWVRINRGGPDTVEGILIEVKDDFVYVVTNEEVVRITLIHIKNVSNGAKIEKAKAKEHDPLSYESPQHESLPYKSPQHESLPYESPQHESLPYESPQHESLPYESLQHESLPNGLSQLSNDLSTTNSNRINRIGRQNFEGDLSDLLSSMEKFLRNYSRGV
jgi:hypothetical protein